MYVAHNVSSIRGFCGKLDNSVDLAYVRLMDSNGGTHAEDGIQISLNTSLFLILC